ncbi:unnamed protein product [Zymoseptoria tritici ST99CH_1E4]|uniref:D-xylose 1-dehydrogenase (NADP(+), D-xylono-1,5-lactone-forming) n=1 Tax=Zymoseptoria tritici ST99CH_1E4 TaxID=1276532 RepID=A0A2H1H058_ZYMTR|nr:unnamed protein product [Zymoseptoria tritici ST99CH_1E4]
MSWIAEAILNLHNYRNSISIKKSLLEKSPDPLRIGILSAAAINYAAIIDPIATHPSCTLHSIAARSLTRAEAQIKKYSLGNLTPPCKPYGSYQDLLDDDEVDAVYIPLPNGLHAEWTIKALRAGKHVLVEKPMASNAEEVREVRAEAEKAGRVVMEAFHWRFHPAAHWIRERIDGGGWGVVEGVEARFKIPRGALGRDDIRFSYDLAGGASMDLAYVFSACCYFSGQPTDSDITVTSATPRLHPSDDRIDEAMDATFTLSSPGAQPVTCHAIADIALPPLLGIIPQVWELTSTVVIDLMKARVEFSNFSVPTFMHSITGREKDQEGKLTGKKTVEKVWTGGSEWEKAGVEGEAWWTTYRWQLEGFVRMVRAEEGGEAYTGPVVSMEESEQVMRVVDAVYEKAGMPKRGL